MSHVKTFCDGVMTDPSSLKPHPRNPNKHGTEQIRLLVKVIRHHGWRWPVIASKRSGFIVAGHARVLAGKEIGCDVPVTEQAFENEADEIAFMLADNRIAELADLQIPDVNAILVDLDAEMGLQDIEVTGYTDGYLKAIASIGDVGQDSENVAQEDTIRCPKCGAVFNKQGEKK